MIVHKLAMAVFLVLMAGCAKSQSENFVVSRQFGVCANVSSAVKFELDNGLDALSGRVSQEGRSASIYIGRHPEKYGVGISPALDVHDSLRKRLEVSDRGDHVIIYSYVLEISGFDQPVYDEIFISIKSKNDLADIAFARRISSSLFRCVDGYNGRG